MEWRPLLPVYLCEVAASDHVVGIILERILERFGDRLEGSEVNHAIDFVLEKKSKHEIGTWPFFKTFFFNYSAHNSLQLLLVA